MTDKKFTNTLDFALLAIGFFLGLLTATTLESCIPDASSPAEKPLKLSLVQAKTTRTHARTHARTYNKEHARTHARPRIHTYARTRSYYNAPNYDPAPHCQSRRFSYGLQAYQDPEAVKPFDAEQHEQYLNSILNSVYRMGR